MEKVDQFHVKFLLFEILANKVVDYGLQYESIVDCDQPDL